MKKILSYFWNFFPAFKKAFVLIGVSWKQLTLRMMLADLLSVSSSIGFVIVPSFLVGAIFLLLPQGRDTLLLVVEQMSSGSFWSLAGLLLALTAWSLSSELGVRYAIAISDNSGMNLTDERVKWRYTVQKLLAATFLLWPTVIVFAGFSWAMFTAEYFADDKMYLFYVCLALVFMLMAGLGFLYFHKFGKGVKGSPKRTIFGHRSLPAIEQKWLNKLYGIYSDYIYSLPKPSIYRAPYRASLQGFTNQFTAGTALFLAGFPQDVTVFQTGREVPVDFELLKSPRLKGSSGVLYKWVYCIPTKFYKGLHRQVLIMFILSIVVLVGISLVRAESSFFRCFGAPGLVCLALACYTGLYSGLLYLDKALLRNWRVSVRFLLIALFVYTTFANQDHPVRLYGEKLPRTEMTSQFAKWFAGYKKQMDAQHGGKESNTYPVIFICAEGGAFRTGAYTGLFLTKMEAVLAKTRQRVDFRNSIFGMSGVSGGAVGLGFYNAVAFRDNFPVADTSNVDKGKKFFLYDSLSPLIGKMFFGEFLNLFIPTPVTRFDRAAALEKSWEVAYTTISDRNISNTYLKPFILKDTGKIKPMLIINTTEIETGTQCWVTNVQPNGTVFQHDRDLLNSKVSGVRYSTAINFSSRFPLFSPGAEIDLCGGHRRHYLDGGYVEHTGTASMQEMLQVLRKNPEFRKVTPVVISLLFSEADSTASDVKAFSEITEIFAGIYNTRGGRSKTSQALFRSFITDTCKGVYIAAPLKPKEKDVPMNWVLSQQSMNRILNDVNYKLVKDPDSAIMRQFFKKNLTFLQFQADK